VKKKTLILGIALVVIALICCFIRPIPEPQQCAMCTSLPHHALCIINLSTGEKVELNVYEPHPFLAGEIADEQTGGYFCFIHSAGVEGYKIAAEFIVAAIPIKSERIKQQYFCSSCRKRLEDSENNGYVLVDLLEPKDPVVFPIHPDTAFSVRCYSVAVQESEDNTYKITVTGHHER